MSCGGTGWVVGVMTIGACVVVGWATVLGVVCPAPFPPPAALGLPLGFGATCCCVVWIGIGGAVGCNGCTVG